MKLSRKAAQGVAVLAILSTADVGFAQPRTTGSLVGSVTDAQSGILPGAAVVATNLQTGASTDTVTGADGRYSFPRLPAGGPYRVTATMAGFRAQEKRDLFVSAGEERRVDFELQLASIDVQVTVTAGATLAQEEKRLARNIKDVVSADSVGRFPDTNAAEALRRIPGVSQEIDQGEGRFVVVRGIDSSLNTVTLNGQIVGTPAEFGTRGINMDSVPADLVSRLEVTKAVTPDKDANAIGALIDIATLGAFDLPGGFLFGSLRSGYNEMSGRAPFTGSASFGRVLGKSQRWGLVVGASYSRRRYESELFRAADLRWANFNGYFVPQLQGSFLYDIERRRQGVNAALEFRPSKGHGLALRFNHNLFQDNEGRQQVEFDLTRGTLGNQTPTSGRFSAGRASREYRDYLQKHLINAAMLVGNHAMGRSSLDWRVGASRGERDTPKRVDWEFRSGANAFPNTYDVSDPLWPQVTPPESFYTAGAYPFRRVRFRTDLEREDVLTAELNLRRHTSFGTRSGYWKAGAKLVGRDKGQDRQNQNYNASASSPFTLADFGLSGPAPDSFFEGRYRFGPTLNLPALQEFFQQNPSRFTLDPLGSLQNSLEQDFDAREYVYAGYLMAGVDFSKWNLLAGVRVESTRADYFAKELLFARGAFTGRTNPVAGETDYTDVLPGLHVNFFPSQKLTVRLAWTNTLGRPAYADLAPIRRLDDIQNPDGSYTGTLSSGNSTLKPFESMNLDLSLEYYLKSGLISVAPFYKRIANPIYDTTFVEQGVTYNERYYERLTVSQPENAERGWIAGIELNYQNMFSSLPSPFDGLGLNLNATLTNSSVTVFGRNDELPFFKQSKYIGNVALIYEKYGITAQVAVSFNSAYLGELGADAASDNYSDRYTTVEAKIGFPLVRKLRGFMEFRNLNDEPRFRYGGAPDRRVQHEIYGRDLWAGLDWRF